MNSISLLVMFLHNIDNSMLRLKCSMCIEHSMRVSMMFRAYFYHELYLEFTEGHLNDKYKQCILTVFVGEMLCGRI